VDALGDEIVVVINRARPISQVTSGPSAAATSASNIQKVRRGDLRRAVIVRTRFPLRRADGRNIKWVSDSGSGFDSKVCHSVLTVSHHRFDDNACVLLNNKGDMVGTRVNGVVAAELREVQGGPEGSGGRWSKILSLAGKVSTVLFWAFLSTNVKGIGLVRGD
jgi:ribosomal protein L14